MFQRAKYHRTSFFLGALFLVIIVAAFCTRPLITVWEYSVLGAPCLVSPDWIEVTEKEFGTLVETKFVVSNSGKSTLQLTNFRKGCACDSLAVVEDGKNISLTSMNFAPGKSAEISFTQRVRGEVGKEMSSLIGFETNDPSHPNFSLSIRGPKVTGGLFIIPEFLDVGSLLKGQIFESYLELFCDSGAEKIVVKVLSTAPDQVQARFIPLSEMKNPSTNPSDKNFLGRVLVRVRGDNPGGINSFVKVFLQSRPDLPDSVKVFGKVVQLVEFYPDVVRFPQQSETGKIYQVNCIARSPYGQPFTLEVKESPRGISVEIESKQPKDFHSIKIAVIEPSKIDQMMSGKPLVLSFFGLIDGKPFRFTLPIQWNTEAF